MMAVDCLAESSKPGS